MPFCRPRPALARQRAGAVPCAAARAGQLKSFTKLWSLPRSMPPSSLVRSTASGRTAIPAVADSRLAVTARTA